MSELLKQIEECTAFLSGNNITAPNTGIVLGTGLRSLIDNITIEKNIPYSEIPHFPVATIEFHNGQLIYGTIGDK